MADREDANVADTNAMMANSIRIVGLSSMRMAGSIMIMGFDPAASYSALWPTPIQTSQARPSTFAPPPDADTRIAAPTIPLGDSKAVPRRVRGRGITINQKEAVK